MKDHRKLVSVIIPVYKTEQYLGRCLDSVLKNTYKELEVICVNDGSPDNSLDVLYSYANKDNRIIVIDQENQGVSAARNAGLDIAKGDFIAFIDSDDWVHPQYFEALLSAQEETGASCVACKPVRTEKTIEFKERGSSAGEWLSLRKVIENGDAKRYIWGRIYKKTSLSNIRFSRDLRIGEDTVFNLQVLMQDEKISFYVISDQLYYYFMREDSAVHTIPHKETILMNNKYFELYKNTQKWEYKKELLGEIFKKGILYRYLGMYEINKEESEKEYQYWIDTSLYEMRKIPGISLKERFIYFMLAKVPLLYRLMRIVTDPTMIQWESEQRKKLKEYKAKS